MSRWRRIALPASIVLNLFLIAAIGGHVLRHRTEIRGAAGFANVISRAEALLPPKDAAAFDAVIRRDQPRYTEAWKQFVAARRELARAVTAEPFDKVQVGQAVVAWRMAWNRFFDQFDDTLVEALAQVSPEGRRKLIAERERMRRESP